MRILLTNDDGVEAEGLACLERIARTLSDDVWICAPELEQSGKGRGLTLTEPLRVKHLGEKKFAVTGTPTDCIILAVNDLMAETKPDLVLSAVNRGTTWARTSAIRAPGPGRCLAWPWAAARSRCASRWGGVAARWRPTRRRPGRAGVNRGTTWARTSAIRAPRPGRCRAWPWASARSR